MDVLDKLIEQYKEIKSWKKQIPLTAGLMTAVGIVLGFVGAFMPSVWWIFLIFGGMLVISGITFFLILWNTVNKVERKVTEVLNSAEIPENQREKLKAELGLK
ncbi:MAG: hypothetical protein K2N06_05805 [Oscillospiraceae bacterium]|nr:hypothetical protein [Oscillospiraceae bacterium]